MLTELKLLLGDRASLYSDALLNLLLNQAQNEVEGYCNRSFLQPPADIKTVIERIAIIKLNRLNTEGLTNQSAAGVSEAYEDGYPADIVAVLNRHRRIKVL
ncbi:MAG: phage head-tail connector protein [Prevotellaceae bacterium]|nr:phage head-tail connector protein [Candidatus Faecinaster equi]